MTQKEHSLFRAPWAARPSVRTALAACPVVLVAIFLTSVALKKPEVAPNLAGTNDAALEYAIDPDPQAATPLDAELVASRVKARLSAAEIAADVDATPEGRVRVVVDADAASTIDALVTWRGGLTLLHADAPAGGERDERPPIAELPIAGVGTARRGKALALTFPPSARDAVAAEKAARPGERVTLARGRSRLATMTIEEASNTPLVFTLADDVTSYVRVAHVRDLLATAVLPPMRRLSATRLPVNHLLAAACAILPFLLSLGWLAFVRRFDRARPEPLWLVLATFVLGGLSVVPAGLAEIGCAAATPWLDPSVMTLGGQTWALPVAIAIFTLVVGVSEEGSKFLGAWSLASHRREFDEPVDGIIYASAASLGFAAVENIKYFAVGRMSGVVIAVRAFVTVPAHLFFGAIWGYALGRKLVSRRTSVLAFFLLAAAAHGTFDALLSTNGMQLVSTALVVILAFAFVSMLQSALRYGAVSPRPAQAPEGPPLTEPMPASEIGRAYFRVGSSRAFYAWAGAIIVCAFALTVLGGAYEYLHHRIGIVFVSIATLILGLFGVAAYRASSTIPLDVAIDTQGVTLGGARTVWRSVVSMEIEGTGGRAQVVLHTTEDVVRLGPTTLANAHVIAASIRSVHAVV
jgi:RsiW-degrading membrane proteinase PrsW (M82 family)